jgi:5-methylcytosine-specific restriction endonuclease McrA
MARGRESAPEEREKIIGLFYSDMTAHEVAISVGRSYPFVIKVWKEAGLPRQMTKLQKEVKALREKGMCCVEIADALGKSNRHIISICDAIGLPFTEDEVQRSIELGKAKSIRIQYGDEFERRQKQIDFIANHYPQFEYVSGYVSSDDYMELRCKECGTIFKRYAGYVRRLEAGINCPACKENRKKRKQEELARREAEKEAERQEEKRRKTEAFWGQKFQQVSFQMRQCKECGTFYIGGRGSYCSEECKRKHINRKHDKRLDRAKRIDKSISLKKLYKRDKGICWICGGKCDYKDYVKDENGYFIVGANYPSIDHVYPLSKGGNHEWSNVKLAHHYCNTLKNDKVVAYG